MPQPKKPSNATWIAKTKVHADDGSIDYPMESGDRHPIPSVEVAWYPDGRIKVTFDQGAPVVITQVYLTGPGRDAIVEIAPRS